MGNTFGSDKSIEIMSSLTLDTATLASLSLAMTEKEEGPLGKLGITPLDYACPPLAVHAGQVATCPYKENDKRGHKALCPYEKGIIFLLSKVFFTFDLSWNSRGDSVSFPTTK